MRDLILRIIGKICHLGCSFIGNILPSKGCVYMLHEISDNIGEFCISVKELDQFLSSLDFNKVINLLEWERNSGFIAITIDDVPENFYLKGYPLFVKYGIPFTIFVNISLLDKPGFLTTNQLKELSRCELCTIGSHGTLHEFYRGFSKEEKLRFLEDSQKKLSKICNSPIDLFAFPYGSVYACGLKDKKLVSRFYKYGFGTITSNITSPCILNYFFLPRKNLSRNLLTNGQQS